MTYLVFSKVFAVNAKPSSALTAKMPGMKVQKVRHQAQRLEDTKQELVMWKGVAFSMSVLAGVMLIVALRQIGGETVVAKRSGAAMEVAKRSTNRTVPNRSVVLKPWDLREMKVQKIPDVQKPKKVFEATSPGFTPQDLVLPTGGMVVSNLRFLEKFLDKKCVKVFAVFDSKDETKTRKFAGLWRGLFDGYKSKFDFGLCDIRKEPGGFNVARKVHVTTYPTILFYPSKNFTNESIVIYHGTEPQLIVVKAIYNAIANLGIVRLKTDGCFAASKDAIGVQKLRTALAPRPPQKNLLSAIAQHQKTQQQKQPYSNSRKINSSSTPNRGFVKPIPPPPPPPPKNRNVVVQKKDAPLSKTNVEKGATTSSSKMTTSS